MPRECCAAMRWRSGWATRSAAGCSTHLAARMPTTCCATTARRSSPELILNAQPMWTDEVARMGDVPDTGPEERYRLGIPELDHHGFRITLPAFWPIIGPYGSGKSVLLRQVLCLLWQRHRWPCLLTSFEEKIKPRYQRDLRRNLIGRPMLPDHPWTPEEIAAADAEIDQGFVFLQRAKGKVLDVERLARPH